MFYHSLNQSTRAYPPSRLAMTTTVKPLFETVLAFLTSMILVASLLFVASSASAQSAAELDWVPASELSENQLRALPPSCVGQYIQPEKYNQDIQTPYPQAKHPNRSAPDQITVTAKSGLHIIDHSTTFNGDVEIRQGNREVNSEYALLSEASEVATLEGAVSIREPGLLMLGENAEGNLFAGTGFIDTATFILHQSRMRGSATRIYKGENNLLIEDGIFTRCEPQANTWSVHGNSINMLTDEGFGVARDVTLKIKDVPVAYFPYFRFPINDDRLSGFLMPGIGQRSDGGTDISIPYYFNLAPNYDATYTFRSLWKRGLIHGAEFRHLSQGTANLISGAFLHKDDIYDDRTNIVLAPGESLPEFEKQDRWLIHAAHDGGWNSRWKSSIRYSAVSDNEYLSDIGGDIGSTTSAGYSGQFDDGEGSRITPALNRIGSITYRGKSWTSQLLLQGFQNLDDFSPEQYEKLPEFSTIYRTAPSILRMKAQAYYTYFDKNTENAVGVLGTTGQRGVVEATIDAPFRNAWGYIKPSVNVIHRQYDLENEPVNSRSDPELTTPSFSVDSGLIFDRFFNFKGTGFQQTLEPRLYYLYTEFDEQKDLPQFDASVSTPSYSTLFRRNRYNGYDRVGDANQVSIGLSSSLIISDTGAEVLRAAIGQAYYFRDREVVFQPKPGEDPTANSSPIFTQLRVAVNSSLSLTTRYEWDQDNSRTNRGSFSLKYHSLDQKILNVTYTYTHPDLQLKRQFQSSKESDISYFWPIAGNWSLIGRWNYNWDDSQTIESLAGVEYNDCCWKLRLAYRRFLKDPRLITVDVGDSTFAGIDQRADTGVFLEFQLKGLASLGGKLDNILEDAIPGYRARENQIGLQ
jgi:LPS-assembly protein